MRRSNRDKVIVETGLKRIAVSRVSICSIVRDCQKNLRQNIIRVEKLRKLFLDSEVIVFENDSKDQTLKILKQWQSDSSGVTIKAATYGSKTIPTNEKGINPFFSRSRIEKMSFYRNQYLEILNSNGFSRDFVIVVDLDIADFNIKGVAHSFGSDQQWSCIAANGTSLSKHFRKQYHDSYALIEKGALTLVQDEITIETNRAKFSFLKNGMPLFPVDSAFGGLAIYDWKKLKGKYYDCRDNNDKKVQVCCEHVFLNSQLDGNVFINPYMEVKYRRADFAFLFDQIRKRLKKTR